jgi:MFS family permease
MTDNLLPDPARNNSKIQRVQLNFWLIIGGRLVSNAGSAMFNFALSLYVLHITGSAAQFSLILGFSFLPLVLVNLLGGVWVDRYNKKQIIVWSDLCSGLAVLVFMAIFQYYPKSILLFIGYALILNSFQAFFGMAINAAVPDLVNAEKVPQVNSITQAITAVSYVAGPVIGALVFKAWGMPMVFLVNGIALLLAGTSEIFLAYQPSLPALGEFKSYLDNIKAVFIYIRDHKILGFLFIFAIVINFIYNSLMFLVLPYINYNVFQVSELQMSLIQASAAFGVILGGIFVSTRRDQTFLLKKFFTLFRWQAILIVLWIFPLWPVFSAADQWPIVAVFGVMLILYGGMNTCQNVPMISYFQLQVPEEMRGRLFGVLLAVMFGTTPVGLWIYGAILTKESWYYVTCVSGLLMIGIGIYFAGHRYFKEFRAGLEHPAQSAPGEDEPIRTHAGVQ